jgi:16S rRNA (cytidine1402-2'-O)-methyltransferase
LLVFYEAPHRLAVTLADMAEILGDRDAVVARELTKMYEELGRGSLSELAARYRETPARGEVVVLVAPATEVDAQPADVTGLLQMLLLQGVTLKDAVRRVVELTGEPRSAVYETALQLKENPPVG